MKSKHHSISELPMIGVSANDNGKRSKRDFLIYPERMQPQPEDDESLDSWGFKDSKFKVTDNQNVMLTGNRYSLCGQQLPHLLPWVRDVMGVNFDLSETNVSNYPPQISNAVSNLKFLNSLKEMFDKSFYSEDGLCRLRHGHGHTQFEIYAIKYSTLNRIPDLVVYPDTEKQVSDLVKLAVEHNVCLIPFGGGTNVTEALLCPENEKRMIVSVDMRRLNRILWIDPVNNMACIQAGAVGRNIASQLREYGYTMGHEPDSIEFSTLGGWIATNASGMKKNKYGNIEDLVLDMNVVTVQGELHREAVSPREATGIDPSLTFFGSEGNFGIITSAIVKIFPLPEVQRYGSILFPSFEEGCQFLYELKRSGEPPASIRLVDNLQFQFSMALKPASHGFKAIKSKIEKSIVTKLKGFDPKKMVACTLVFEGTKREVQQQQKLVYSIAKKHGGMKAGAENGQKGYQLTYGIAYIRDFVMDYHVIAESFETSVSWDRAVALCDNVKRRVHLEHKKRNLPGTPFITCRVTQLYDTGVCIYFYFAYYYKGVANPSGAYAEIEMAAREEILLSGGSLSHHHGVGKLRQKFLPEIKSPTTLRLNQDFKHVIDPLNIFGANNQALVAAVSEIQSSASNQ